MEYYLKIKIKKPVKYSWQWYLTDEGYWFKGRDDNGENDGGDDDDDHQREGYWFEAGMMTSCWRWRWLGRGLWRWLWVKRTVTIIKGRATGPIVMQPAACSTRSKSTHKCHLIVTSTVIIIVINRHHRHQLSSASSSALSNVSMISDHHQHPDYMMKPGNRNLGIY